MNHPSPFFLKWFPGELNHDTGFHNFVSATVPKLGKILDLGCGDNDCLTRYRTSELEAWGTDFDAHPDLKHVDWFRLMPADGLIPFADQTFDLVSSYMVMEHVTKPAAFLGEIARVLKPNGVFIGQSIQSLHYVTWIRRLFDVLPHSWVQRTVKKLYGREEHDTFPTCYRLNRKSVIARAAKASNLETIDWRGYASQGYFSFSPLLFRLAVLFDWGLERIHPGLGKIYFTVILRKPPALAIRAERQTSQAA